MLKQREKTNLVKIKNLEIGNSNKVIIQTMTLNKTSNTELVIKEILSYEKLGCELIRVSVLDEIDANSIKEIVSKINIPLVADIHFDYKLALLAIENGAAKIRINPGNIKSKDDLIKVIEKAKLYNVAIRIGINTGSIKLKTPKDLVQKILSDVKFFELNNFYNLVLSIKSSDPVLFYKANILLSKKTKYPIHLGLTESGDLVNGLVKSSIYINKLIEKGIGNTIRISLPFNRENEISACKTLLKLNNLHQSVNLIICPTCGRISYDLNKVYEILNPIIAKINYNIKISLMGCIVNGIGEAEASDISIFGNKGEIILYFQNKFYAKTTFENLEKDFLTLIKRYEEINKITQKVLI